MSFFKDISLQKNFENDGYIIVPLLSSNDIAELKAIYSELPEFNESFHSTSFYTNLDLKNYLDKKVTSVLKPKVEEIISNYIPLGSGFLTKKNADDSIMPIHQDWTVVDESKYISATVWIPLQDTDIENGAIQVIPGSHKFSQALRSPSLEVSFSEIYNDLLKYLKSLPMKAGEAFIFNHALMHASSVNKSPFPRIAVTFGFASTEADLFMYYRKNEKIVEKFEMPDDMFIRYPEIRYEPQLGKKSEEFQYTVPKLSIESLQNCIYQYRKLQRMKPLFKDAEYQKFFEENGYIVLPALNQEQVQKLLEYYESTDLKDPTGYGFHVGMDNIDKSFVKNMVDTIKNIALPSLEHYFENTQIFTASFVIKESNPKGVVPPHQDWSFVEDEKNYCSATCWIALQDVNADNGCMGVIKGSHQFFDSVRASPSPQVETPIKDHMFTIFPYINLVEMKAGEALIFDNRTIHASPPNITDKPRLAIGLGFTQKEASICHYYLKPGTSDQLLKYKIQPDFFLKYDNSTLSKMYNRNEEISEYGHPETVPFIWENITSEDLICRMIKAGNSINTELVVKMTALFGNQTKEEKVSTEIQEQREDETDKPHQIPLWKVYTPANIFREVKYRLTGS
jgi:ectoine hydroxylase-related dioxygenase (phytanoyl-CoA dioxygenase family)